MDDRTLTNLIELSQEAERSVVSVFHGACAGYVDHKVEGNELLEMTFVLDRLPTPDRRALRFDFEDIILMWRDGVWQICRWDGQPRYEAMPTFEHASEAVRLLKLELATLGTPKLRPVHAGRG